MRVQLIGGTNLFLEGLVSLFEKEQGLSLLPPLKCKSHCHRFCHLAECHVILIDMSTGRHNSFDCIRQIMARNPAMNILVLIDKENYSHVNEILKMGATGVISMAADRSLLLHAMQVVADGAWFVEPSLAQAMTEASFHAISDPFAALSSRENTVLKLILQGGANHDCADKLNISKKTVANHFTRIKKKLAVKDSIQLTRLAIRHKLIKP